MNFEKYKAYKISTGDNIWFMIFKKMKRDKVMAVVSICIDNGLCSYFTTADYLCDIRWIEESELL